MRHPAASRAKIQGPRRTRAACWTRGESIHKVLHHAPRPLPARHPAKRGIDSAPRRMSGCGGRHHRALWIRARRPAPETRGDGLPGPGRDPPSPLVGRLYPGAAQRKAGAAFDQGASPLSSLRFRGDGHAAARPRIGGRAAGGGGIRRRARADPDAPGAALVQCRAGGGAGAGRGAAADRTIAEGRGMSETETAEARKTSAAAWFAELRDRICAVFESIEDEYAAARPADGAAGCFERTRLTREGGGGREI